MCISNILSWDISNLNRIIHNIDLNRVSVVNYIQIKMVLENKKEFANLQWKICECGRCKTNFLLRYLMKDGFLHLDRYYGKVLFNLTLEDCPGKHSTGIKWLGLVVTNSIYNGHSVSEIENSIPLTAYTDVFSETMGVDWFQFSDCLLKGYISSFKKYYSYRQIGKLIYVYNKTCSKFGFPKFKSSVCINKYEKEKCQEYIDTILDKVEIIDDVEFKELTRKIRGISSIAHESTVIFENMPNFDQFERDMIEYKKEPEPLTEYLKPIEEKCEEIAKVVKEIKTNKKRKYRYSPNPKVYLDYVQESCLMFLEDGKKFIRNSAYGHYRGAEKPMELEFPKKAYPIMEDCAHYSPPLRVRNMVAEHSEIMLFEKREKVQVRKHKWEGPNKVFYTKEVNKKIYKSTGLVTQLCKLDREYIRAFNFQCRNRPDRPEKPSKFWRFIKAKVIENPKIEKDKPLFLTEVDFEQAKADRQLVTFTDTNNVVYSYFHPQLFLIFLRKKINELINIFDPEDECKLKITEGLTVRQFCKFEYYGDLSNSGMYETRFLEFANEYITFDLYNEWMDEFKNSDWAKFYEKENLLRCDKKLFDHIFKRIKNRRKRLILSRYSDSVAIALTHLTVTNSQDLFVLKKQIKMRSGVLNSLISSFNLNKKLS